MKNTALVLSGQPRNIIENINSIYRVIEIYGIRTVSWHFWISTESDLSSIVKFKSSLVRKFDIQIFGSEETTLNHEALEARLRVSLPNELHFRACSQFLSLRLAYLQIEKVADIDFIIRMRPDLYCPPNLRQIYPAKDEIIVPYRVHSIGTSDIYAIAERDTFGYYANFIYFLSAISDASNLIDAPEINLTLYLAKKTSLKVSFRIFDCPCVILRNLNGKLVHFKSHSELLVQNEISAHIPNLPRGFLIEKAPSRIQYLVQKLLLRSLCKWKSLIMKRDLNSVAFSRI